MESLVCALVCVRDAGTAYVDLATQLLNAPYTDGYETVWSTSGVRRLRKAEK